MSQQPGWPPYAPWPAPPVPPAAGPPAPPVPPVRRGRAGTVLVALLALVALAAGGTGIGLALRAQQRADRADAAATTAADRLTKSEQRVAALTTTLASAQAQVDAVSETQGKAADTSKVAETALKSVVTIETSDGLGSGFALAGGAGETFLVTNAHVVEADHDAGVDDVSVHRGTEETYPGRVVGYDRSTDLAVVRIAVALPVLTPATAAPAPGEQVVVIGAPLGLSGTVTTGVVSALRDGQVQFSAPISPGNSGGPVLDAATGQVLGVAEQKIVDASLGAEALGFAIPVEAACGALPAGRC